MKEVYCIFCYGKVYPRDEKVVLKSKDLPEEWKNNGIIGNEVEEEIEVHRGCLRNKLAAEVRKEDPSLNTLPKIFYFIEKKGENYPLYPFRDYLKPQE